MSLRRIWRACAGWRFSNARHAAKCAWTSSRSRWAAGPVSRASFWWASREARSWVRRSSRWRTAATKLGTSPPEAMAVYVPAKTSADADVELSAEVLTSYLVFLRRVRASAGPTVTIGGTKRAALIDMIIKVTVTFVVPPELLIAQMSTVPGAGPGP
jgi:hypothetical protein